MEIRSWGQEINGTRNCTIRMDSGDHVAVVYTDPHGKTHTVNICPQHLVLMVTHEESKSAMVCRPAVGVQFVQE